MSLRSLRAGLLAAAALLGLSALPGAARAGATFDAIKARGTLNCGVNVGSAGFSQPDSQGVWRGLDADLCRFVATALFGDPAKVRFLPLTAQQRFTAAQAGEVDVLIRQTTLTLSRDTTLGLRMVHPYLYDGHGFMVRKAANLGGIAELGGATVCLLQGTTNEVVTADWARTAGVQIQPVLFDRIDVAAQAFFSGRCDAIGTDATQLASARSTAPNPGDYVILPERISKEPYGPVVRRDDPEWFDVIRWVTMAVVQAEELGVNSTNAEKMRAESSNPEVRRLLGVTPDTGQNLKLPQNWAYDAIRKVGNYGEIYDRNIGPKTPLGLERGMNALWTEGGLLYAWPMR
ncbi:amino acid ABC transporter substrate-binding protein [Roseomonas sp. KE0001]|uniref:amino acid ABC transporter substrate-binding protein n=1 Tax=unclassified Roseomonas TaxID=2617492 RepID=UPI0018DF9412|nr:amino acid ABC transporter substrate-binding protein [Roseomonas sp. KE0001]MBI0433885.1 amino acid ABC transporter substrate-binding protein [Roseomonas sp. KE0001]